jgi:hypothetical protein
MLLATAAVLAVSAGLPGGGVTGLGGGTAEASGIVGSVDLPGAAPGLPRTGLGAGDASASPDPAAPAVARPSASSCTAPCSTSQVVSVTVLPGPLALTAARAAVDLRADGDGVARGVVSGTRVTDLRGVGDGWALSARLSSVVEVGTGTPLPDVVIETAPTCRLVAGPLTLETAAPASAGVGGTVSLCRVPLASRGSLAGGVVETDLALTVRGAPPGAALRVALDTSLT